MQKFSSIISLTSALDGVERLSRRPGHFTPQKETRCSFYSRLDRPQGRSEWIRINLASTEIDIRTVQPGANCYTN